MNAGFPTAIGKGAPLQTQSIWRRIKNSLADRELFMVQIESGGRRCFPAAVVARIGFETVVEEDVPVVLGVSYGEGGEDQQANQTDCSPKKI